MTKLHHPNNKLQRKLAEVKKHKLDRDAKKKLETEREYAQERASKVWRKLQREALKERETEDELRNADSRVVEKQL